MFRFRGFTSCANDAVNLALSQACLLGHTYIGSEHLLLGLLLEGSTGSCAALHQRGVHAEAVLEQLIKTVGRGIQSRLSPADMTPRCRRILEQSILESRKNGCEMTGTEHILLCLLREKECYAVRFLMQLGADPILLYRELCESMDFFGGPHPSQQNFTKKETAHTALLDKFGRDLTQKARSHQLDPVIGREQEIERVIRILCRRSKNNPCLVGEAGVGKTAIAEGLAQQIAQGRVPPALSGKRLIALDLVSMVAGTKYRGEFEERVKNLMDEAAAVGDIILFIDEIHNIIGAGAAEGSIDAANILKPQLSRGEIQLMGATTVAEYRRYIEKDSALERRFQKVNVEEPDDSQTVRILRGILPRYEQHHGVHITEEAVQAAVRLSRRYLNDRFLPDKAIDLIDEAASRLNMSSMREYEEALRDKKEALENVQEEKENAVAAGDMDYAVELHKEEEKLSLELRQAQAKWEKKQKKQRKIMEESHVAEVVSRQTKIPVSRLEKDETRRLQKLEKILHERVVGQDEAVEAVSRAVRRGRVGLKDPNRPIGSFLFLGPTGVGKTELSKTLAEAVFGSEKNMIRVDMSEYMEKQSVSKMIGSPPGYVGFEEGGQLSEKVRRNPYSVLLFDEIEKAHPDVFNMLLQILEDGRLTDSQGRQVDFKNTIIIMTSNAGANRIVSPKTLGFLQQEDAAADYRRMREGVMEEVKHIFKPEFINRIDEILVFHMLSKEDIHKIAANMLTGFKKRVKKQMDIRLQYGKAVVDHVADKGFDKDYGARPLRRTIQKEIEDQLAEKIVSGEVHIGDDVRVSIKKDAVCVQKIIKKG